MHRIIRVYSLLAVLLDPIVHVFLENTVYGVYTVHRIIRVYSMLSKEKGPYGATMQHTALVLYACGPWGSWSETVRRSCHFLPRP